MEAINGEERDMERRLSKLLEESVVSKPESGEINSSCCGGKGKSKGQGQPEQGTGEVDIVKTKASCCSGPKGATNGRKSAESAGENISSCGGGKGKSQAQGQSEQGTGEVDIVKTKASCCSGPKGATNGRKSAESAGENISSCGGGKGCYEWSQVSRRGEGGCQGVLRENHSNEGRSADECVLHRREVSLVREAVGWNGGG
mmetsp:Transcript_43740/g.171152  ORF Transcript_43740/g.171152 Transcript_43740/m.171152 type:complete len:201 (+) Transcript_43740:495-1097(+)